MAGALEGRRLPRRIVAAGMAAAAFALVAPAARGATATLPNGGSAFDTGTDGWTPSGETCSLSSGPALLCSAQGAYDGAGGNPGGALDTQVTITLNLLGLFSGGAVWTSPPFTVPAGATTAATLRYDRSFQAGGLIALGPTSTIAASLVDVAAQTETPLGTDPLTDAISAYEPRELAVAPAAIVAGRTYRLRLAVTSASSLASLNVLGAAHTLIDNVGLTVTTAAAGPVGGVGGNGGNGDRSGTSVRPPLSDRAIAALIAGLDVGAERGLQSGGSVIPLSACTIVGTSGPDRIIGTPGNDVICGLGGDDVIVGGGGRDAVDGADGDDRLVGSGGGDALIGAAGDDRLDGGAGGDRVGGGAGNDRLSGGAGKDRLSAGSGNDRLSGGAGKDRLSGGSGNDRLRGGGASDRLAGGAGRDRLVGGSGNDRIGGGKGRDTLRGGSGKDRLAGGSGNDLIVGGKGRDRLRGGSGNDRLRARDRTRDLVDGGRGRDRAAVDGSAAGAGISSRTDRVLRVERRL